MQAASPQLRPVTFVLGAGLRVFRIQEAKGRPGCFTADMQQRDVLRLAFNNDAARYDLTRPRYPADLFDDLAELANLDTGSTVFEIGCGTGQATLHMAARGWRVRAVDLGDKLAAHAAARVEAFPGVTVETASFDTMPLEGSFDAVAAFTSFHWLDPQTRVLRSSQLLEPGGALVVVDTHHVAGADPFFERSQDCYLRWDPDAKPGWHLSTSDEIELDGHGIDGSGLFSEVEVRTYPVDILYTTSQYLDLLRTYSHHATMHPENQARLFGCLSALIESQGGSVTKSYVFSLTVARRAATPA
jgi:SAM-dependent methyltransferase